VRMVFLIIVIAVEAGGVPVPLFENVKDGTLGK